MSEEMSIKHHLSAPLLMGYSAGTLPEAFNLLVATHISMCDECRAELASYDAVGGTLLEDCGSAEMSGDALATVLACLGEDTGKTDRRATPRRAGGGVLPTPLSDYVGGDLDAVKWRSVGGGVRQAILETSPEASVRLLHIPAGMAMPDHGHHGQELTLVLQGAFRDESERFARGDVEIADEDTMHTPVAEPGEDCICLAATDAPLKFKNLLARLAQPFFRI